MIRALLTAAYLLLLVSLWLLPADARMHHPARGHRIVPAANAPLDAFTTPSGAYSLRKLRTAYAGSAVRLRRASDNLELDVGFTAAGDFNISAASTHCAATSCFLRTWYDQSGNARDAINATAATQPQLIFNCIGTLPCAAGPSASATGLFVAAGPTATSPVSLSAVTNRSVNGGGNSECRWLLQNGAAGNRLATFAGPWYLATAGALAAVPQPADAAWHTQQGVINGASSVINVDGTETTGSLTAVAGAGIVTVINSAGVAGTTCQMTEGINWNAYALTPVERTALTQNQKDYWAPLLLDTFASPSGAYSFRKLRSAYAGPAIRIRRASDSAELDIGFLGFVPGIGAPWDVATATAHCASTTCFGVTWYDQSGLAKDSVQATPANQPQLIFNCNGSLPCLRATATAQALQTVATYVPVPPVTFSAVGNRSAGTSLCVWPQQLSANAMSSRAVANQWIVSGTGNIFAAATDNVWHSGIGVIDGASSVLRIDGTETPGTITGLTVAGALQGFRGSATTTCNTGEVIAWDNYSMPVNARVILGDNQKSFWGTP